jgi:hypothetical protein
MSPPIRRIFKPGCHVAKEICQVNTSARGRFGSFKLKVLAANAGCAETLGQYLNIFCKSKSRQSHGACARLPPSPASSTRNIGRLKYSETPFPCTYRGTNIESTLYSPQQSMLPARYVTCIFEYTCSQPFNDRSRRARFGVNSRLPTTPLLQLSWWLPCA